MTFAVMGCFWPQTSQAQNYGMHNAGICSAYADCFALNFAETNEYRLLKTDLKTESMGSFITADGIFGIACGNFVVLRPLALRDGCTVHVMKWHDNFPAPSSRTLVWEAMPGSVHDDTVIQTSILNPSDVRSLQTRLGRDERGHFKSIQFRSEGNNIRGLEISCLENGCTAIIRVPPGLFLPGTWN